jgi:hypothetical protein
MGNVAHAHWPQYGWDPVPAASDPTYSFVPGQEDPRTRRHGHTISLHLKKPIRDPQRYLLYHEVFEKARMRGAVTGYAHLVGQGAYNARGGMALDVPFGLVDFAEVLQFGCGGSSVWFDFLNLGYKLAPSAGTDYAGDFTLPGAERSYVRVQKPFTLQAWFDGLKRGETFVTNGPVLEFTVNGNGMGSELQVKSGDKLIIDATASINPDIDSLNALDLIEQGEVIKTVSVSKADQTSLKLHYETTARHGTWFVIRARGKLPHKPDFRVVQWGQWDPEQESAKLALSAAVYVHVDGQSFWKPAAVSGIVRRLKQDMEKLMAPEAGEETEGWEEPGFTLRLWNSQKDLLKQRIDQVLPVYDRLVAQAEIALQKR